MARDSSSAYHGEDCYTLVSAAAYITCGWLVNMSVINGRSAREDNLSLSSLRASCDRRKGGENRKAAAWLGKSELTPDLEKGKYVSHLTVSLYVGADIQHPKQARCR
jgi:hypothetical protein